MLQVLVTFQTLQRKEVLFGFESFLVNAQIFLQSLLSLLNNLLNVFSGGQKMLFINKLIKSVKSLISVGSTAASSSFLNLFQKGVAY
ncbi:hypothetical protein [Mycoplasmoides pneumoniae]|uniref:hypothetical protein n=1 Tax=Mycoplasmoides pneumoniae TaxID=2104 RepID=UPI000AFAF719|nr:hypothetical protein [Mycoplasmoides pneumoniae]